jgi:hypothetical protein
MKFPAQIAVALAVLLFAAPGIHGVPANALRPSQNNTSPDKPTGDAITEQNQSGIPVPLPKGKKLLLTNGSFQLVREYSVQGDRVRYWSIERSAWEEIPAALVDWDATRKSEAEQAERNAELKTKIHAGEVAERTKDIDVDRSLEIKPGLFLPDGLGFYALDNNKLIYEMKQSVASAHLSKGRETERILTGVPIIPRKQTLEIPDARAALRLTTTEPEFFMRPADEREPRFRLLHAQVKNGHRVLENITTYITGDQAHKGQEIDFQTWTPAPGVFRYTVNQRLEPGEYAFVEMTSEGISGYVWDFGIDAPAIKSSK